MLKKKTAVKPQHIKSKTELTYSESSHSDVHNDVQPNAKAPSSGLGVVVTSMCQAPVSSLYQDDINKINLAKYLRKRAIVKQNPKARFPIEIYKRVQNEYRTVH